MIKLDLNRAVRHASIMKFSSIIQDIHTLMEKNESQGFEYLGWKDLPSNVNKDEINKIIKTVKFLRKEKVNTLVVIGIGGSFLGAKAGIDMIKGLMPINNKFKVIFAGTSLSSQDLVETLKYVEKRKFAINVISKSGTTIESALAFRYFKSLLEEQVGKNNASKYIIATTDANRGALLKIAKMNNYTRFVIPDDIGGRYSVLTPVGLFPLAFMKINIKEVLEGAKNAQEKYSGESLEENDAYKYAVARYLLGKKYNIELLVSYEPRMEKFAEWWKQLFGESEGKNEKGLFPASAIFTRDLHSLGQYIQEGKKQIFETTIAIEETILDIPAIEDSKNLDDLNYLVHKTVNQINKIVAQGVADAHILAAGVPNIVISVKKTDPYTSGELFYFFMKACAMSAYLLNVNPFNQPGVEVYKLNAMNLLGKNKIE